ncbi:Bug family tripartite tricarboxylate transporter substrate binding protein [Ammoniphilus sp. 3BR4]|uniref:Bug family tripartite tricarboxylate transporter substrate binding protein n=1 Tax=Ammoniphilus sp. 3BR4 TaxID=3158265 RepID=UPI003465AB1E
MKKKVVSLWLITLLLVLVGCSGKNSSNQTTSGSSSEQSSASFPEKNITLIAPYEPGGGTDRVSRILADAISKNLPNNAKVIVENRPGGSSTVGLTYLYNSKPDGYTLAVSLETGLAIKTHTDKLDYKWDSFTEIMTLTGGSQLFVVKKDAPWKTAEEWLQYVKDNPGKFRFGHGGIGSIGHLAIEEANYKAGLDMIVVPYNGTGPTVQALLAGDVDGSIVAASQVDPELMTVLFNIGTKRTEGIDAPTLKELGLDAGTDSWIGLLAPPGLPEHEFQVIHDAFKKALEDPEVIKKLTDGQSLPFYNGPEEFTKIIEERYKINGEIMKNIGMIQ